MSTASTAGFILLAISSLLVSVPWRILLESLLPGNSAIDLPRWDHPLFHKAMRDHRRDRPVEEVGDSVMNSSKADAELANPVAQFQSIRNVAKPQPLSAWAVKPESSRASASSVHPAA